MHAMRPLSLVLAAVLFAPFALAQHHQHHTISFDTPVPEAVTSTGVTRTFTVVAHQFSYTITPSPFTANLGDTVVINATSSDVRHGLVMERYVLKALVLDKGKNVTTTFVADKTGEFLFLCDQSACGVGHAEMDGLFRVEAVVIPAPTITSFEPASATTSGGTAVTITGTNFQSGATVKFGAVDASGVNVQSATTIVAMAPPQAAGTTSITVTNPDVQSATANGFTYIVPAPAVTTVSPSSGPSNGGTIVQITGANFQNGATVMFGTKAAQSVVVNGTNQILAITPAAVATEQQSLPADIIIRNPDGQSVTATGGFTYTAAPLSISAISPGSGSNDGGTIVSISGSGFTSALAGASVTFGGVPATELTVHDAATLTVKLPPHANGNVDVAVTMGGHTVTALAAFTYEEAPTRRRGVKK
jgi:IPT/TIG domain